MTDDFRTATSLKNKPEKRFMAGVVSPRWWEVEDAEELASSVTETGNSMKEEAGNRLQAMLRHARMYENADIASLHGGEYGDAIARQIIMNTSMMTLNVAASCVDTLTAKITKNSPRPMFLTSGASWDRQIRARNLDKWSIGLMYQTKVYQKARQVFVDGCEFGTGILHVFADDSGKLDCERVLPSEIFVDDIDGQYGCPRQMFRLKFVQRDILIRMFPEFAQQITDAGKKSLLDVPQGNAQIAEDTVEVWEAWHLPSGEGAKDGRHVIAISGCVLSEEQWKCDKFPFVVYRFKQRTTGFWGKGAVETVQQIQIELNRVIRSISQQIRRKGKGRIFVPMGSKVVPAHLTNADGGDVVYFAGGVPPHVDNSNAISVEEFNYVEILYLKAHQELGISELSATAKKPAGLDAAVALREYSDIESERFAPQHKDWERLFMDFIELSIDLITKQYGWKSYKVLVPGRQDLLEVDWENVSLDRDVYIMQMFPVSSLPRTPAARMQAVEELRMKGYVTDPEARRLLDFPDIEAEGNLGNAIIDDVDATISAIMDREIPELLPLEPYQNLDMVIERGTATYLYARHRNCPEERLALLRNLIDSATLQKAAIMTPPPAPGLTSVAGGPGSEVLPQPPAQELPVAAPMSPPAPSVPPAAPPTIGG